MHSVIEISALVWIASAPPNFGVWFCVKLQYLNDKTCWLVSAELPC